MKVIVRKPKRREIELPGDRHVNDILKALDLNPETFIVIQGRTLLTRDTLIRDGETVEILSAISGGA